jgi:predicted PurR-regulated permease PerM
MKPEERPSIRDPRNAATVARTSKPLWVLICALAGVLLYFAAAAFIPVALALLFALLLSSPVEALHRQGLPRSVSAILILMIFLGLTGGAVNLLWDPAQQWLAGAPRIVKIIEHKIGPVARVLHRIDAVTDSAGHLTDAGASASPGRTRTASSPSTSGEFLLTTRTALIAIITVVILTLFLLAGGPPMLGRMAAPLASDARSAHVLQVIDAVRSEVGRYYGTIALINLGLGLATGLGMMVLGMPSPILWGALAAALNFIPYVGSATTLIVLTVVAIVSFDGTGRVLAVAAIYLGLATIEGQIVQPLLVGRRLELNPSIVFLALWFGGWFWGISGIVMAIPSLVALKIAAEHSAHGAPLVEFLSPSSAKRFKLSPGKRERSSPVNEASIVNRERSTAARNFIREG